MEKKPLESEIKSGEKAVEEEGKDSSNNAVDTTPTQEEFNGVGVGRYSKPEVLAEGPEEEQGFDNPATEEKHDHFDLP